MQKAIASLIVVATLGMSACGGTGDQRAEAGSDDADQQLEQRVAELEREKEEAKREAERAERRAARERSKRRAAAREARQRRARERRARARAAQEKQAAAAVEESGGGGITVPDVVGLDHQAAQNALQGEGLYDLDERDCSGQGRMLLFDRNWEVVSVDPPVGSQVTEDTRVTLCSVKQGEG